MKISTTLLAVLLASGVSAPAFASQALATSKGCLGCHKTDVKLVGPSYQDVAAKYAGQKGAEAALAEKMMKGSSGVWGPAAMPPNPGLSADDAKTLAKWALSGGK